MGSIFDITVKMFLQKENSQGNHGTGSWTELRISPSIHIHVASIILWGCDYTSKAARLQRLGPLQARRKGRIHKFLQKWKCLDIYKIVIVQDFLFISTSSYNVEWKYTETESHNWTHYLHDLRNPEVQCRVHKGSPIISILSRINPITRIDTYLFKVHSNIVLASTPRPPQRCLSCRFTF